MNDAKLIQNLKLRKRDALEKAIRLYGGYVDAVLRGVSGAALSREDREELSADTFLALWNHVDSLDDSRDSLRGYLGAIARNKALSRLRVHREELLEADELILRAPAGEEPEEEVVRRELGVLLLEVVNGMGEPEREIFLRYYYRREKVNEIAEQLGMNGSTVKTKLARGRKKLRDVLCERGYDCEDSDFGAV